MGYDRSGGGFCGAVAAAEVDGLVEVGQLVKAQRSTPGFPRRELSARETRLVGGSIHRL